MDVKDHGKAGGSFPDLTSELRLRLRELEAAETPEHLLELARSLQSLLRHQKVDSR
jgi:hypothetical protein